MRTLLIATTNQGKLAEMLRFLETLPFKVISLADLDTCPPAPDETTGTIEGNAMEKARYYAEKTGFLTIADDSGLFIDALDGWPGVDTAEHVGQHGEHLDAVLEKMKGITNRKASFEGVLVLFDPSTQTQFIAHGSLPGSITTEQVPGEQSYGANKIFYVDEREKAYSEMGIDEKNEISHRAVALNKLKYQLQNQYSGRNIVVPIALIAKGDQLLMSLRADPHRKEFDRVWEFPGGGVEYGETVESTLVREVKEEIGYDVEIISPPLQITSKSKEGESYRYNVHLIPYVCKIVGGDGKHSDAEVIETKWFDIDEVPQLHLFDDDDKMIKALTPRIREVIAANNL